MQRETLRENRRDSPHVSGRVLHHSGVLNDDRARNTIIERIRDVTRRAGRTAAGILAGFNQLTDSISRLNRASKQLKRTAPAVGIALQHEMKPKKRLGHGMRR
jgi:hypothetical protein